MLSLIDSNVLIRAHDASPSPYSAAAVKMLAGLAEGGTGVLSTQSLAEFAHHAVVEFRLDPALVKAQVRRLATVFPVLPITDKVILRALNVMATQPIGFYDAQVWALARMNGIQQVVTEGLWHKQVREKVRYYDLVQQAPTMGWQPHW